MPPTFPEARAAKAERQRREARYFHPGNRGTPCPVCKGPTSLKLQQVTGIRVHPTCSEPALMALAGHGS